MTVYKLVFNVDAEKEFLVASLWYEEQQPGLGKRFEQEVEKQLRKIISNPLAFHFSRENFRESSVGRFPFTVVYVYDKKKQTIYVASIFHTIRDPKEKYRK